MIIRLQQMAWTTFVRDLKSNDEPCILTSIQKSTHNHIRINFNYNDTRYSHWLNPKDQIILENFIQNNIKADFNNYGQLNLVEINRVCDLRLTGII